MSASVRSISTRASIAGSAVGPHPKQAPLTDRLVRVDAHEVLGMMDVELLVGDVLVGQVGRLDLQDYGAVAADRIVEGASNVDAHRVSLASGRNETGGQSPALDRQTPHTLGRFLLEGPHTEKPERRVARDAGYMAAASMVPRSLVLTLPCQVRCATCDSLPARRHPPLLCEAPAPRTAGNVPSSEAKTERHRHRPRGARRNVAQHRFTLLSLIWKYISKYNSHDISPRAQATRAPFAT